MVSDPFDFIIVGAGSAGCALAARLTEGGEFRVLLLEAGGEATHPWMSTPLGVGRMLADPSVLWAFETEPEPEMNDTRLFWPRGKVLGGSSSINGMLYVRGDPVLYDKWRDTDCPGWGYEDLLPLFKRIEDRKGGDPDWRGVGGPIKVTDVAHKDAITEAFFHGCQSIGIPATHDYNTKTYEGVSYLQLSVENGKRCSAERAYLKPARHRENLEVQTQALVTRVVFERGRAVGVEWRTKDGGLEVSTARKEVILCGGALCSPLILERSGIGDAAVLDAHDIDRTLHLPGVGANLQDHLNVRITYETDRAITLNDALNNPVRGAMMALKYALTRRGLMATSTVTVHALMKSDAGLSSPDLKLQVAHVTGKDRFSMAKGLGIDPWPGFSLNAFQLQPASRGSIHIRSADPADDPVIKAQYLTDPDDQKTVVKSLRLLRDLAKTPEVSGLIKREVLPGPDVTTDDELLAYARATGQTSWHTVGTCKMGSDAMAVVGSDLKVHGVEGLRIADASVVPFIVSANTNAAAYVVAERCADLLVRAWNAPQDITINERRTG
ncbi:GMC family oxidoreductase N-terminal domain-containing protein [Aestuariivita sp.]|jgi:choline dehydrogenase|uniref:GMC family oxidoreductase n=1 Tax=Aestuariivita sp. TaxID=1872407 RepID=UPI00216BF618|nr:GMC family oxidoreductase N-terminal domain-containing protein [Aestuariivita sp.]MCE8007001.1 glucose-methanol-choline oxidoreductase [Aestuariivita sp.]